VVTKRSAYDSDDPMTEVAATAGLLLMFTAVIGVVMGVAVFGMGSVALATAVIVMALMSFVASLACFMVDARRHERAEAALPFPSMLRR
jgi:hypothetical protein